MAIELILRPGEPRTLVQPTGAGLTARAGSAVLTPPPTPGSTALRVGMFGFATRVGKGPDGTTANPYTVCQINPHQEGLSNLPATLALAQQKDILLVVMVAGGGSNYGATEHSFDLGRYEARLDLVEAVPGFNAAVAAGRVHIYAGDEPNMTATWGNTWSPTLFNAAARACKDRWPTGLVHMRLAPTILKSGWAGFAGLPTYDAIDYGWLQYAGVHRKNNKTYPMALAEEKAAAASINVGVTPSLNLVNAGLRTTLDGVAPCWDHDLNAGTASGIIIGVPAADSSTGTPFTEGQFITCASVNATVPNSQNLMVSPLWGRRIAEMAKADPDAPFFLFWTFPGPLASNDADILIPYIDPAPSHVPRSDFLGMFQYAQAQGLLRTSFNGMRTPKP